MSIEFHALHDILRDIAAHFGMVIKMTDTVFVFRIRCRLSDIVKKESKADDEIMGRMGYGTCAMLVNIVSMMVIMLVEAERGFDLRDERCKDFLIGE